MDDIYEFTLRPRLPGTALVTLQCGKQLEQFSGG